jgi:hypothetical protein
LTASTVRAAAFCATPAAGAVTVAMANSLPPGAPEHSGGEPRPPLTVARADDARGTSVVVIVTRQGRRPQMPKGLK